MTDPRIILSEQTADQTVNASTVNINSQMVFDLQVGKTYTAEIMILFSSATLPDIDLGLADIPTNNFGSWGRDTRFPIPSDPLTTEQLMSGEGTGVLEIGQIYLMIVPTQDMIMKLTFAQNSSRATDTILKAGSRITLWESDFQ